MSRPYYASPWRRWCAEIEATQPGTVRRLIEIAVGDPGDWTDDGLRQASALAQSLGVPEDALGPLTREWVMARLGTRRQQRRPIAAVRVVDRGYTCRCASSDCHPIYGCTHCLYIDEAGRVVNSHMWHVVPVPGAGPFTSRLARKPRPEAA